MVVEGNRKQTSPAMPNLSTLSYAASPSTADRVYESLYQAIISLELPPGSKVSEVELAKRLDVSRQPVREAFYRLSQLGFLMVRPQRATLVTKISDHRVKEASFIRLALETACFKDALGRIDAEAEAQFEGILQEQQAAITAKDNAGFQRADDRFHQLVCTLSGHETVWKLVQDQKAHIDRVRFLSMSDVGPQALAEHKTLLAAMLIQDQAGVERLLHTHLLRINAALPGLRASNEQFFEEET